MKQFAIATILIWLFLPVSPVTAEPDPGYYDTVDQTSSQAMRDSVHEIIDDHTRIPYTSSATDTWDVLEIADENQDVPNNIVTIYRNATYLKVTGGNDFYNREHTCPKSYGFPDDFSGNYPYTDMPDCDLEDTTLMYY